MPESPPIGCFRKRVRTAGARQHHVRQVQSGTNRRTENRLCQSEQARHFSGGLGRGCEWSWLCFQFSVPAPSCSSSAAATRGLWRRSGEPYLARRGNTLPTDVAAASDGQCDDMRSGALPPTTPRHTCYPSSSREGRMRTWTLVAAGLRAASVGTTAAVSPEGGPAAGQQEEHKKKQQGTRGNEHLPRPMMLVQPASPEERGSGASRWRWAPMCRLASRIGGTLEGDAAQKMSGAAVLDVLGPALRRKAGSVAEARSSSSLMAKGRRKRRQLSVPDRERYSRRSIRQDGGRTGKGAAFDFQVIEAGNWLDGEIHESFFWCMSTLGFESIALNLVPNGGPDARVPGETRGRSRCGRRCRATRTAGTSASEDLMLELEEIFGMDKVCSVHRRAGCGHPP